MSDGHPAETQPHRTRAFVAAWLGWCFDGLDGYLYIMVAMRLVRQLLEADSGGVPVSTAEVISKSAIIQAGFLVGWAVGGAFFGRIGDRIGRATTLTLTVLTYAVFTGASYFAAEWWHLLLFRFIAALGIGGEWAAGSALVSEMLHERHRWWASATLQSGYMVGCIAASFTAAALRDFDPRTVFIVGVLPALFTVWIRWAVPEPKGWTQARREQAMPPLRALFGPGLLGTTIATTLLTSITLTTVWAFLFFGPALIQRLPDLRASRTPEEIQAYASWVSILYLCVNIGANFFATYLARCIGYRAAFAILIFGALCVTSLVFGQGVLGFGFTLNEQSVPWLYSLIAFFGLGLFGIFPLYIPPLFPTLLRTLGAGFSYNVGRLVSAVGAIVGGQIAAGQGQAGAIGLDAAIFWTGLLYIPGLVVCLFIREIPRGTESNVAPQE
ncbi:MAG: MFS transporter [Phycisphaerales bacterium]